MGVERNEMGFERCGKWVLKGGGEVGVEGGMKWMLRGE